MSSKKQPQNLNKEENFEKELIQSLRYYGYLFLESTEDVERFDAMYGDTEIEMPKHLESIEEIKSPNELHLDFDLSYNVAAFSSNDQSDFKLTDDLEINDCKEHPDESE